MPKRTDIHKVLVIGSGPIVIGQAAEFDYAGTQACLALREEGYEVILANSNPATIQKLRRRISSPVINSQARDSRLASVATMAVMTRTTFQPRAEESRKNTKISAVPRRILVISRSNSRYRFLFPTLHPSGGQFSTGILSQSVRNCNRFDRIR